MTDKIEDKCRNICDEDSVLPYPVTMLSAVLCAVALGQVVLGEGPQVTTSQGTLRGQVLQSRDGRHFFSFTKIPYAKPPLGERRFMISETAGNWTGIWDATKPSPVCFQRDFGTINIIGQEDCLYLNVFSPNLTGKMPVIIFIHGGGFTYGSAGSLGSAKYFMDEDVVFVAPNYRLGTLGFLSLEDNVIPGNMGLKDQALAVEWVHREIRAFGGDPNLITVFGQSAGGASSDYICSSPRINGIIKACVSQSGVALSPWALSKPGMSRQMVLKLAKAVGCGENGDLLKCLQSKPIEQVGNLALLVDDNQNGSPAPVIEPVGAPGALITSWPTKVNHNYPWMMGVCQDEGLAMTAMYELGFKTKKETEKFINDFNQSLISTYHLEKRPNDFQRLYERYFKNGLEPIRAIRNYFSEVMFVYPSLKSLSKHPGSTYFYKFNYTRGSSWLPLNIPGDAHGCEMAYLFELNTTTPNWPNAEDINLSKHMVKMWVNFARDQIPSSQGMIQWPQFKGQYFLDIQQTGVKISNWTEYKETLAFWNSIIPESSKSSMSQSSWLFIAVLSIFSLLKTIL